MTNEKAFDLTPNYGVIFRQFLKDAANAGEYLSAGICGAQFDEYPEEPQEVARRAAVLLAVQAYLAPVTIALQCATSVAEVEQVREVMAETLKRIDTWAAEFEGLSEPQEEEDECDCADRSWYGSNHDSACPLAGKPRQEEK